EGGQGGSNLKPIFNLIITSYLTIISFCVIGLTYMGAINLCVLCVFVVRSGRSLALYLRIHFTHRLLIY
ncbi:hypothetical protein, partial [Microcystis sp. T1-4]|uniref:hypothetical protein n=1 Tax=Microcystis sp. T1-4 TaxID=1160279 RepID=UPI000587FE13